MTRIGRIERSECLKKSRGQVTRLASYAFA